MNLDEKELKAQLENYFNTRNKEEIMNDLIISGGAKLLNLKDVIKKYVVIYCSKEKYNDSFIEVSDFLHKTFDKAESEITEKGYKHSKSEDIYVYNTGDNSFEMWAYIKELIEL